MKKNTLILIAVCAVIALTFYLDDSHRKKEEKREEKDAQITALKQDEVNTIAVGNENGEFKAQREGDRWKIVEPFETAGDKNAWDNLARNYSTSKRQRVVAEAADDMKPFGLDIPSATVVLSATDGRSDTVFIGAKSPVSGRYFARVGGASDVVTVGSSLHDTANKSLFELRDKTLVELETDKVQRIEVKTPQIAYTVEKRGENEWVITDPVQGRANESKLRTFINRMKSAEIKQFIDENPDIPATYGLAEPATRVAFWTGDPGAESSWASRAIVLGGTSETTDYVYASREGQKTVFAITPNDFNDMPITWKDLRQTKIASTHSWDVKQFKIVSAGETILEASKDGGDWMSLAPQQGKADYSKVSELVRGIVDLEASDFVQGATTDYGLDHPDLTIELQSDAGTETIALAKQTIGDASSTRETTVYYGARENPLEIYSVSSGEIMLLLDKVKLVNITPVEKPDAPAGEDASSGESSDDSTN
ncbi:MAG: DUF4340 domain-containing protein [bacterium]|nr:DUF4340 domain-containing protein [bacterium]